MKIVIRFANYWFEFLVFIFRNYIFSEKKIYIIYIIKLVYITFVVIIINIVIRFANY